MILFAFLVPLLALASASPTALVGKVDAAQSVNDCDYGTYEDHTNAESPFIADCLVLADNISGDGTWSIGDDTWGFRQLAQYGSCAFTVVDDKCADPPESHSVSCAFLKHIIHIGNEDIRGAIHNAVENSKKMWNPAAVGRVGAQGVFNCQTSIVGQTEPVRWTITWNHNPVSGASASPTDPVGNTTAPVGNATAPVGNVHAARTINDCDTGTYQDVTDVPGVPALIADCMRLAENILGDGTWIQPDGDPLRRLAYYKTCAFSTISEREAVENGGMPAAWHHIVRIGNEDIRGAIHNAVDNARFLNKPGTAGMVGAKGVFTCETDAFWAQDKVWWYITDINYQISPYSD